MECPEAVEITEAVDEIEINLVNGIIRNLTKSQEFQAKQYEPFMMDLLEAGGLIEYTKRKLTSSS